MTNTNEQQSISLCFVGLPLADQATVERVVSFCKARGQNFETSLNPSQSDVLVTDDTQSNLATARQLQNNNLLLVVSNDKNCTAGDVQLQRPLLVTRVMRTMETLPSKLTNLGNAKTAKTVVTEDKVFASTVDKTVVPVVEDDAPPAIIGSAPTDDSKKLSENDYIALVIDDSAAIRKQLEIELRTAGLKCEFAEDGEQALAKAKDTVYDLIFLDIMMPGIDGYETCGRLRKDPRYKKTPVIMLSGKTSPLDEVKGVLAGASTYLTKPVKHEQFQRVTGRITRWLDEFR